MGMISSTPNSSASPANTGKIQVSVGTAISLTASPKATANNTKLMTFWFL